MKRQPTINLLVIIILILSAAACLAGLLSAGGNGTSAFTSIRGETVSIYGRGLYRYDSTAVAAQGLAQDLVTLVLGVPLLLLSLVFTNRGSFRARLLLTGTLGYFLYSYMSYVFLWNYNPLFLVYVGLMSASLYAFVLMLMSFDVPGIPRYFSGRLPVKALGIFQLLICFALGLLWLGKIAPTLTTGEAPAGLEHYTTLVIQGMDLGFIVPTAAVSGVLLLKRRPWGYLLTSVVIFKAITMLTCLTAMIINQALHGITMPTAEILIFPVFNLLTVAALIVLLKNIRKQPKEVSPGGEIMPAT